MTDKKFKILFLSSDTFPPFRVDVSILFGQEMVRRGHQIDWMLQSKDDCKRSYSTEWSGSRVLVGSTNNGNRRIHRLAKNLLDIKNDLLLVKLLKYGNYDFIQVKDKFVAALIAGIFSKRKKIKFFFWLSYPFPEADIYRYKTGTARYPYIYLFRGIILKKLLYKIILPISNHIFVQSEQMKKDVISNGIQPNKITPVPMGININDYNINLKENNNNRYEPFSILYLGTMIRLRRIDFIIKVFKLVKKSIPEAKLYMVGSGEAPEDIDYLKQTAVTLNVDDSTFFTGELKREIALEYVKKANVCISPFYPTPILNSTSPTKLIEYMAMGKPVVANEHPEQIKVIKESNAGYCVPYEENAFAKAIIRIIENPATAKKMGENGREYVLKKRSYFQIANMLERKYTDLLI